MPIHPPFPLRGAGIGLRHKHLKDIAEQTPDIPWLEVHTENFFSTGSAPSRYLEKIRAHYPLSAHCVGLSLGSAEPVAETHLARVKSFMARFEPALVSDHVSWSAADGAHLPDLLPLPYTEEALEALCRNILRTQDYLGRAILIENPSSYVSFPESAIPEWEFMTEAARRTGCGVLLDVNNIYVSAHNHDFDPLHYLSNIPAGLVGEMHLAGYELWRVGDEDLLVDTHGAPVYEEVWELFRIAARRFPHAPALIEWDTGVPALSVLLRERRRAASMMDETRRMAA